MAGSKERVSRRPKSPECPHQVVERFMQFANAPFGFDNVTKVPGHVWWDIVISQLDDNSSVSEPSNNGVSITQQLEEAFKNGGLAKMKTAFLGRLITHTAIAKLGPNVDKFLEKIIGFE